ncbi:MAG: hypothetical protein F6J95_029060 [Leptolyngbya sp. SIO1E4]|nr:hypothetical protein [Leptolyngbya sp. SIO1E4]
MKNPLNVFISLLRSLVIAAPILGFLIGSFMIFKSFNDNAIICESSIAESKFRTLLIGPVSHHIASALVNHVNDLGDQFDADSLVPKGSVIAIDFEKEGLPHWRKYPVIPVVNSEGLGIFYVIRDFRPQISGTCFSIH